MFRKIVTSIHSHIATHSKLIARPICRITNNNSNSHAGQLFKRALSTSKDALSTIQNKMRQMGYNETQLKKKDVIEFFTKNCLNPDEESTLLRLGYSNEQVTQIHCEILKLTDLCSEKNNLGMRSITRNELFQLAIRDIKPKNTLISEPTKTTDDTHTKPKR